MTKLKTFDQKKRYYPTLLLDQVHNLEKKFKKRTQPKFMKKRRKNYYRVIFLNAEGTDPQNNVIALIWGSFLFHLKTTTTTTRWEKYKRDESVMASIWTTPNTSTPRKVCNLLSTFSFIQTFRFRSKVTGRLNHQILL